MYLTSLPYELLLYLLEDFIELEDLWCLSQVSRYLRSESIKVLLKKWEIDFSPSQYSLLKIQYHSALVSLSQTSRQLLYRIKPHNSSAFPSFIIFDLIELNNSQEWDPVLLAINRIDIETGSLVVDRLRYQSRRLSQPLAPRAKAIGSMFSMIRNQAMSQPSQDRHIKLLIDIVFHHATIIQGKSIGFHYGSLDTSNHCRLFSVLVAGMLSQLTCKFPDKSMTGYLMKGIMRFIEQTSYRLLSLVPRLSPQFLLKLKLSRTTKSNRKCIASNDACLLQLGARKFWSCIPIENKHQDLFILILHSVAACGDLIGACFNATLLKEMDIRCILLKLSSVLSIFHLEDVKKSILTDLKEAWFISHTKTVSPEFVAWLQSAIENNP